MVDEVGYQKRGVYFSKTKQMYIHFIVVQKKVYHFLAFSLVQLENVQSFSSPFFLSFIHSAALIILNCFHDFIPQPVHSYSHSILNGINQNERKKPTNQRNKQTNVHTSYSSSPSRSPYKTKRNFNNQTHLMFQCGYVPP